MTLHVPYNHQCPKCEAYYIPFDLTVPCPRCGEVETKRFDFIPRAVESARYNLRNGGRYVPAAWFDSSLGDHVLAILFHVLDHHREDTSGRAFPEVAAEALARLDFGDQLYARDHVHAIACRVREQLEQEPPGGSE